MYHVYTGLELPINCHLFHWPVWPKHSNLSQLCNMIEVCKQAWGGGGVGWGWRRGWKAGQWLKGYQGTAPNHSIQQCLSKDLDQQVGIVPNCLNTGGMTQWHGINCKDLVSSIIAVPGWLAVPQWVSKTNCNNCHGWLRCRHSLKHTQAVTKYNI